ncbi:MAG: hypothetical protein JEZ09_06795 [Salinivirgaceae bacterium]|nr:hypothetical protein [Salinivirgaceae bacterium]
MKVNMELTLNRTEYINNKLEVEVDCAEDFNTIGRIDLLEYNGNIIKTFTHVSFNYGHAVLIVNNMEKGSYLLRIRDSKVADILKLEI